MALTVDYIYKLCLSIVRKNQAGSLTSNDFQYHWNAAQNGYHGDLLGRFNRDNNGKAATNTGLIENQTILTKLSPFTKNETLAVTSGAGDKPADFVYALALRIGGKEVTRIVHDQIANVNDSVIDAPSSSADIYYYNEYEDYYSFLPNTVSSAELDYIAAPPSVVWGYTIDGDGRQVYDSGSSVQPLWDTASAMEITQRMLRTLGVAFSSRDFQNFGETVKNRGD